MITKHATRRLKQWQGVNKGDLNKIVSRALSGGIKHSGAKGWLRSWMDVEYLKYQTANNLDTLPINYIYSQEQNL